MARWSIEVKKTGRTWGVFGRTTGKPDELLEGGFFGRGAAETARKAWERECLEHEVEQAEREAGWDAGR